MKVELNIDGKMMAAEVTFASGSAQFKLADRICEAEISEPEPGLFVVLLDGHVYRCTTERGPSGEELVVNGQRISLTVRDRKHLRGGSGGAASATGKVNLTSPMPGKIVRVLVNVGDEVAANQGVLIVEAMKMQNEVLSPKAGKIVEIRAVEGQTINAGETLVIVE